MKYEMLLANMICLTTILSCEPDNEVTSSTSRIQVDRTSEIGQHAGEQNRRHEELMVPKLPINLPEKNERSIATPSVATNDALDIEITKLKDEVQKLREQKEEYIIAINRAEKEANGEDADNSLETLKQNAKRNNDKIAEKIWELNTLSSKRLKVKR